jgi:hypothetical protein
MPVAMSREEALRNLFVSGFSNIESANANRLRSHQRAKKNSASVSLLTFFRASVFWSG